MKYVHQNSRNGSFIYRRRVPAVLADVINKREFLAVLGKTMTEALSKYGRVHERFEHLINLGKNGVVNLSAQQQQNQLIALFQEWNADPFGSGLDENERAWRDVSADRLLDKYQDPKTGDYNDVPSDVAVLASALVSGLPKASPEPTLRDAFEFYLAEHAKPLPEQRKKQVQRFMRAEKNIVSVLSGNPKVSVVRVFGTKSGST